MQLRHTRVWGGGLVLAGAVAAAFAGCSGGSSGGGSAASTSAPVGSSPSATTTTGPSTTSGAEVTSLVVPAGLLQGSVPIAFRVADAASASVPVEVVFSTDNGQTWKPASGAPTQPLATGPAPGIEHSFVWDTVRDVPGFEPAVLLEVRPQPGRELQSPALPVDNQPVSAHVKLDRAPYLQSTTQTQTVIRWRTETAVDGVVEFGETPALGRVAAPASGAASQEHEVLLTGLTPGTRYSYRLVSGGLPITPRYELRTAPASGVRDFSFLVVGDSGMNNQVQYDIAARMDQEDADFFLHTGDVVYPIGGLGAAVQEYNLRFFKPYEKLLRRMPAWLVVGNHDLYGLYGQPFKDTFTLPPNGGGSLLEELYYSFEWGDAKFVAIEANSTFQFVQVGAHMDWLRRELAQNTKKWLIVFFHPPLYSAGQHGDNHALQQVLGPLFESYGVDLVLTGHDHDYERTKAIKDYNQRAGYPGLVHVVTGGGGADLRPVNPTPRTEVAISAHHYLRVEISGDWLTGEAVDAQGKVIDRFSVQEHQ
ncbi:MAG: metallophosphoesterase [Planctomycetota bacterium]